MTRTEKNRAYYLANKERIKVGQRAYYQRNRATILKSYKKNYLSKVGTLRQEQRTANGNCVICRKVCERLFCSEKCKVEDRKRYCKFRRAENKEKMLRWERNYRVKNQEKIRQYRRDNEEVLRVRHREWWLAHKDNAEYRNRARAGNLRIKKAAMMKLGGVFCRKCKISDLRILTVNHINGRAGDERRGKMMSGLPFYRKILSGKRCTDDLEVLCYNCQVIHEYKRGRLRYCEID